MDSEGHTLSEDEISGLLTGLPPERKKEVLKILGITSEKKEVRKTSAKPNTTKWRYRTVPVKHNFVCRFCGSKFQKTTTVDYLSNNGGPKPQEYGHMVNSCDKCSEMLHGLPKREIITRAIMIATFPNWRYEG